MVDRRRGSFWFVFALVGPGSFNKRRRILASFRPFPAVDVFVVGEDGSFLNVDVLRGSAAPNGAVPLLASTHRISVKSMKRNSLFFQCGMLLQPLSFGQFGAFSEDLCSTPLLGLSKGIVEK